MQEITDPSSCVTSNATDRDQNLAEFQARILARTMRTESGCLLWMGGVDLTSGYGGIRTNGGSGKPTLVHRHAYALVIGPIPDGLHIDHVCHTQDRVCTGGALTRTISKRSPR